MIQVRQAEVPEWHLDARDERVMARKSFYMIQYPLTLYKNGETRSKS